VCSLLAFYGYEPIPIQSFRQGPTVSLSSSVEPRNGRQHDDMSDMNRPTVFIVHGKTQLSERRSYFYRMLNLRICNRTYDVRIPSTSRRRCLPLFSRRFRKTCSAAPKYPQAYKKSSESRKSTMGCLKGFCQYISALFKRWTILADYYDDSINLSVSTTRG
jgi:hypothetical protein